MFVSKLVRPLEQSGLLRRADHPADPRAFELDLTARGADLVGQAAAVMRELFDELLLPIGGRSGQRHAALIWTIDALLDEAESFNRAKGTRRRGLAAYSRQQKRTKTTMNETMTKAVWKTRQGERPMRALLITSGTLLFAAPLGFATGGRLETRAGAQGFTGAPWTADAEAAPQVRTTLYFGLARPKGAVSELEWQLFLRDEVTRRFPDGLTVWEADGQWRTPAGSIDHEQSKVLLLVHPDTAAARQSILDLIEAYRKTFEQQSVDMGKRARVQRGLGLEVQVLPLWGSEVRTR